MYKLKVFFSTLNIVLVLIGYQFISTFFAATISTEGSQFITIPYRVVTIFVSLIVIFLNFREKFKLQLVLKILFIYWILLLSRFFYDVYYRTDLMLDSVKVFQTWSYMLLFGLLPTIAIIKSSKYINLDKALLFTYILAAISVILSFISNTEFTEATDIRLGSSEALNSISTGHLGLTTFILSLYLLSQRRFGIIYKIAVIFITILSFILLMRAGSRGPLLSLMCLLAVYIFGHSKHKINNLLVLSIFFIIGWLTIDYILEGIKSISPILHERLLYRQEAGQFDDRNPLYQYAWESFLQNPIIGKNFAVYTNYGWFIYAHNVFLDSIMQLGIIGGILITYLLWKSVSKTINLISTGSSCFWLGLLLIQLISKIMVSGSFYTEPAISCLIALLFSLDNKNILYQYQYHLDHQ